MLLRMSTRDSVPLNRLDHIHLIYQTVGKDIKYRMHRSFQTSNQTKHLTDLCHAASMLVKEMEFVGAKQKFSIPRDSKWSPYEKGPFSI